MQATMYRICIRGHARSTESVAKVYVTMGMYRGALTC